MSNPYQYTDPSGAYAPGTQSGVPPSQSNPPAKPMTGTRSFISFSAPSGAYMHNVVVVKNGLIVSWNSYPVTVSAVLPTK